MTKPALGELGWGTILNNHLDTLQAKADLDNDVATNIGTSSNTKTALDEGYASRSNRTKHAPAFRLYFPEAEGAVGDGVTACTTAIQAAIDTANADGGGRVVVSSTSPGFLTGQLTVKSGVVLAGDFGATLKKTGAGGNWLTLQDDAAVESLTLDINGATTTNIVYTASARNRVERCELLGNANGVRTADGASDAEILRNTFDGALTGVHSGTANLSRIRVKDNRFTNWTQRAVYVTGSATQRALDYWIEGNHISNCVGVTADPRQPICFEGVDAFPHLRVRVKGNTIVGNNTSYNDPTTPGTADQISLHRVEDFVVADNISVMGGDVGITISMQCKTGSVTGNTCARNDTVGICIGSSTSTYASGITVTGNTCIDNFQNRVADRPVRVSAGIMLNNAINCTVDGNECGDTQTVATQANAVTIDTATNCTIGINGHDSDYAVYIQGTNSGLRWNMPPRVITKTADETVNNTITLQDDDQLTLPVGISATYRIEGLVAYNSSTVADFTLGWSVPTGADMFWMVDGITSTATSANSSVTRTRLVAASTPALGGVATNTAFTVEGTVTTSTTAGQVTLRWAQNTAEVSDTKVLAGSYLILTRIG